MTFPLTVSQLAEITNGVLMDSGNGQHCVTGGCMDSRVVAPGDCFFAIAGEKTHGVLFADQAIARGAACVVTDSAAFSAHSAKAGPAMPSLAALDSAETDGRIIRVTDSVVALQLLARWNRQQSGALVVGVTGSVGKTTTRQMITHVLALRFSGVQSPHNYNNELGVPLALLQLKPEHDFAVLELAAGRIGDIRFLAEMVRPEFAVVTRVAVTHLASFGDLRDIRMAKMELPAAVTTGGTVFLNADDPCVLSMSKSTSANVVLFGTTAAADFRATSIHSHDGVCQFKVDGQPFQIQGGAHLVTGAVAAVAVGRIAGLNLSEIAQGLTNYQLDAGRGRIVQREPWTVIDETYNASPASVLAAIQTLNDCVSARRRILVLGDMLELGPQAGHYHREVGSALMHSQIDHALLFGEFAEAVAAGAIDAGVSRNRLSVFRDVATLNTMLDCVLTPGAAVLVKGSRSMRMERIITSLCALDSLFRRSAA
jgi:UDP-N-acetylmuramoyl-tripeptide--D-alanyl-D-alanine ligase